MTPGSRLSISFLSFQAVFDNLRPVSLDKDALSEQMQAHKVLVSDISDHKAQIQRVAEKCRGAPGAQEMVRSSIIVLFYFV